VYSYTETQAIADGMLVQPIKDKDSRFLMTTALYEKLKEVARDRGVTTDQVIVPLFLDAQMIVRFSQRVNRDSGETLWTRGLENNASGQDVWIALNGMGGLTLMFPSDY
jgi:hypothetical protein